MKAVMYHYIREATPELPNFVHLSFNDFKKQIDYFNENFHILTQKEFYDCLEKGKVISNGVILTFDDGVSDHYNYVYPYLKSKGLWGIFFISTMPLLSNKLLDVHRTHYLLGKYNADNLVKYIRSIINKNDLINGSEHKFSSTTYVNQNSQESVKEFKRIVNYLLCPTKKTAVLDKVMAYFLDIPEKELAQSYYLTENQVIEMFDSGMEIGCHAHSHNLLSNLKDSDLLDELNKSKQFLSDTIGNDKLNGFCFPYGGKQSYDGRILTILEQQRYRYAFSVESRDISTDDIISYRLELPRYDCNEFPHGQATLNFRG